MPAFLIVAIAAALVIVHMRASFRVSMATVVGATLLIPGALFVPGAPPNVVVVRVGLWAAALGILARVTRGDIPAWSIRPTRVFFALSFFVVTAYVLGVARGPFPSRPEVAFDLWLLVFDQLLFLFVATVAVRVLGVQAVARMAIGALALASIIAIFERLTGSGYAQWWYQGSPSGVVAAGRLEARGASVRVRGAADFALQFAWVIAYFLPIAGLIALRAKKLVAFAVPAVIVIAMILTVTRSVFAGVGLGALCLLVTARGNRRLLTILGAAAFLALVLYTSVGSVRSPYQSADPESERVRARRLVLVSQEMAERPWLGVGLDGLIQRGIRGTDNAALLAYASVGIVGLTVLAGAVGTAIVTVAYGAIRGDPETGLTGGAILGGLAAGLLGMFAFDTFTSPISSWNFWLLAALGVGLYEEVRAKQPDLAPRPLRFSRDRWALPLGGLVVGLAVFVLAPTHVAVEMRVFTLNSQYLSKSRKANDDYIGRILVETVCDVGSRAVNPDIKVDCFDPLKFGPGTGIVRLQASNREDLRVAFFRFGGAAQRVANTKITVISPTPAPISRPTWARTAPVVGLLLGIQAALLLPAFSLPGGAPVRRRLRRRQKELATVTG